MADEPNLNTPDAGDLNTEARRIAAKRGWAMADGAYPIRPLDMHGRSDLDKAIRAVGRGGASHDAIRRHIIKRARALGLSEMIPDNWTSGGESRSFASSIEILHRRSTVVAEDVSFAHRIIDVIAVPWGEEAEIVWRGQAWREVFERGAFNEAIQNSVRIPVNREHVRGDTIGRIRTMADEPRGLLASVKVAKTERGDETLQLASEGMLGASVGYFLRKLSDVMLDKRSMTRRVRRAFLEHLSMVESPAYVGAETVAVHDELSLHPAAGMQPLVTPSLDEWMADDILSWASSRLSK